MAEKYFFEERNAKKAASKARTTARVAARTRAAKKAAVGSDTKPFNVKLMTPRELVGGTEPRSKQSSPAKKATEKMKSMPKVKITGTASTTPRVSGSMIKSQPKTTSKSPSIKVTKKITEAPKRTPKNAQTLRRFAKKAGNK
jgi:hypothetical protein